MVESLLDAAARVLAQESPAGFNTNRVARAAGVSVGSLYQYFPNKSALIAALIEREHWSLAQALEAAAIDPGCTPSLAASLRLFVRLVIDQHFRVPLYAAALKREARRLPIEARLREHDLRLVQALKALVARHRSGQPQGCLSQDAMRDLLLITRALVEDAAWNHTSAPRNLEARVLRALSGCIGARAERPG